MQPASSRAPVRAALWLLAIFVLAAPRPILSDSAPRVFTDADKGAAVQLKAGDRFELHLKSNPSTGYVWTLAPESTAIVKLTAQSRTEPAQPGVGHPIVQIFGFQAVHRGQGVLLLRYIRSWEKPVEGEQRFDLHLTVR